VTTARIISITVIGGRFGHRHAETEAEYRDPQPVDQAQRHATLANTDQDRRQNQCKLNPEIKHDIPLVKQLFLC
jgi:hypothetical protein